jgi:DNA polymerase-3 subunit gamma/tau
MSLYRKYRPLVFKDIAGQEHIKQTVQNEIAGNSTVHAYLFSGPRAVGKTTTARIFARALNCARRKEGESEPCNACEPCESILAGRALDIMEIDAASHTGVDNVRENIIAAARVAHAGLPYKVFIIDEVHMLSTSAFNALLKLMEEPPAYVVFILATTELHKVPATIVSRCQRFDFKKIASADMERRLKKIIKMEKKEVDAGVLNDVIRLSEGCLRDAESLLGQILSLDKKNIDRHTAEVVLPHSNRELVRRIAECIAKKDTRAALEAVNCAIDDGVDISIFLYDSIEYFRKALLLKSGAAELLGMTQNETHELIRHTDRFDAEGIIRLIEYFNAAQRDIKYVSLPQLPLEIAVVRGCLT